MFPSFDLGPLAFPAYFTLLMAGFLAAIFLAARLAPRLGIDPNHLLDAGIIAVVFGLIGSRALHVVADGYFMDYVHLCTDPTQVEAQLLPGDKPCATDEQCRKADKGDICAVAAGTCHPGRDCLRAFKFWYGGLTYYGGFLAAFAAGIWFVRRKGYPLWRFADLAGFGIPLGLVFGRIGCFLAGCCYGAPTDSWLGIAFPRNSPAWSEQLKHHLIDKVALHSLHVYPTQLFHVAGNLTVFLVCLWVFLRRRRFDGIVFWGFVLGKAVTRFVIEYWRGDPRGDWLWGLFSTSQLISLPLAILAVGMLVWLSRRPQTPLVPFEPPA